MNYKTISTFFFIFHFVHFHWENLLVHTVLETSGSLIAILTATFILTRKANNLDGAMWFAYSLLCMGILDLFHACMIPGNLFVWTHSIAFFLGGVFISLVWLPQKRILWWVIGLSILTGILILAVGDKFTAVVENEFMLGSSILNIVGGILFLSSFIFYIKKPHNTGYMLFAGYSLLNFMNGILFDFSHLWDTTWWLWHGLKMAAFSGLLYYIILRLLEDYTKRNLYASNKELSQFAYVASHDLKAPLRAVFNLSSWIAEDLKENLDVTDHVELLQQRVKRMEYLINGLLEFSRIGRMEVDKEKLNIQRVIKEVEALLQVVTEKSFEVKFIEANPTRMIQLFSNLINNAVKHHNDPDNIKIEISNRDVGDCVEFCVSDNGPGIDSKYHDKIFQIFQTLEPKDSTENTGIGLSLVKKIVEEYKGKIWVISKEGEGAKFYFTLHK